MKKGFTLVELLAVIVILAVIALIATPMILNVIESSKKGALKDSAYGLMESADIYYAEHTIDGINKKTEFTFEEGMQTSVEQLGYKGRIEKGSLNLYSDGKVALCITDGKYAAIKNVNEEEVRISSGRCSYNEETEEYETVWICSDLESELEKVKEENNKKIEEIRNEYEERISNLTNDYEEQKRTIENTYRDQIEELNRRIEELETNKQAEIDQIRADYEAQVKTQQEAYEAQINELNRQLNTFKTGGTASASQILAGQTAFVKGSLITGSMANRGGQTVTSNTVTQSGENALITVPENGYYDTSSQISVPVETIQNSVDVGGMPETVTIKGALAPQNSSGVVNGSASIPTLGFKFADISISHSKSTGNRVYINITAGSNSITKDSMFDTVENPISVSYDVSNVENISLAYFLHSTSSAINGRIDYVITLYN